MRARLAALVLLFALTQPNGGTVYLNPAQVVSVAVNPGMCPPPLTTIIHLSGTQCVRETPQEALRILEQAR